MLSTKRETFWRKLQKLTAEYEKLTQDAEDMDFDQPQWSRIQEALEQILDLSQPKPSPDLIRKFVSRIVPDGKSNFRWYLNLDGRDATVQDMMVEGRKNHAVVTMCAGVRDAPPDPGAIIDINNTSILATPHRLLSRANIFICAYGPVHHEPGHFFVCAL